MAIEFTLENILAIVIALITLNLLFIGFYILSVLREVKKTVHRAGEVIDEVDRTVKDGIDKAKAMNAPLQALATTATAFGGIVKTGEAIKKATQSILGGAVTENEPEKETLRVPEVVREKIEAEEEVKVEEKSSKITLEMEDDDAEVVTKPIEPRRKKVENKRPRFFRGKRI